MAITPDALFSTITLLPSWDVSYSVEFRNNERPLGNNYLQITDGGNANPEELVTLSRLARSTAVDPTISDLRAFQGSTAFNWRFFTGGNYKLYFCTDFSEELVGSEFKRIDAQFSRHPNPQYDAQPATVADGLPWGLLTQAIRWGAQQANQATPLLTEYSKGEVVSRRPQSIFAAQNTLRTWNIEFPFVNSTRLTAVELFLRQRRGRIPFQINTGSGVIPQLWICSKWNVRLMGQASNAAANMTYSMTLDLRQVYRGLPT